MGLPSTVAKTRSIVSPWSPAGSDGWEGVLATTGVSTAAGGGARAGAVLTMGCEGCDQGILIDEIVLHPAVQSVTSARIAAAGALSRVAKPELIIDFS